MGEWNEADHPREQRTRRFVDKETRGPKGAGDLEESGALGRSDGLPDGLEERGWERLPDGRGFEGPVTRWRRGGLILTGRHIDTDRHYFDSDLSETTLARDDGGSAGLTVSETMIAGRKADPAILENRLANLTAARDIIERNLPGLTVRELESSTREDGSGGATLSVDADGGRTGRARDCQYERTMDTPTDGDMDGRDETTPLRLAMNLTRNPLERTVRHIERVGDNYRIAFDDHTPPRPGLTNPIGRMYWNRARKRERRMSAPEGVSETELFR